MKTDDDFIDRLASVASNFHWKKNGQHILGWRGDLMYDPMTAYVYIAKGEYVPRHSLDDVPRLACMRIDLYNRICKALWGHDRGDADINFLRKRIEVAVGL